MAELPFTPELPTQSWAPLSTLQPLKDGLSRRVGQKEDSSKQDYPCFLPRAWMGSKHPILQEKGASTPWRGRLLESPNTRRTGVLEPAI